METVLKVICDAREWTYQKGDTVERLLAIVQQPWPSDVAM
jgi:hypothetical protein